MKAFKLARIPPPPPAPEAKLCVACKGFRAECVVPVGEASAPMCWLCAHHVVDHERSPDEAMTAECECLPHDIYPGREPPTIDELIQERFTQKPYQRAGASYTGTTMSMRAVLLGEGEARSRVCHCGVCGEEGHYAKTCPTVRRGR